MTGATAAIAELPQIELPHATNSAMRTGSLSSLPIQKPPTMEVATTPAMPSNSSGPIESRAVPLSEAPSRTIAISSRYLAEKAIPACHLSSSAHTLRTAVPIRMAITSASIQALPKSACSAAWSP